jgi:hypothetical protein
VETRGTLQPNLGRCPCSICASPVDVSGCPCRRNGGHIMRFPRMTTQRWMAVTAATAVALWLGTTAFRVKNDRGSQWISHLWERYGSLQPGSIYNSQHEAPFWPRYWRRLLGQPWPGTYACDPSAESSGRYGRLVVTIAAPSLRNEVRPIKGRLPKSHQGNRAAYEYSRSYIPKHWKKDADGQWVNDYK